MDDGLAVILWICFSILVGVVDRNRGHGFWLGLVRSLVLSPLIGVAIAYGTRPNLVAMDKLALKNGQLKKCPDCAELVRSEARICRFCTHELPALTQAAAAG